MTVVERAARSRRTCAGVVPAEMPSTWPAAGAQGPGDRRPLVCGPPAAAGRLVLRRHRRHELAGLSRRRWREGGDERDHRGHGRASSSRAARRIANTLFHSTGGGATENNENVFVSATGAKVAGAGQLPARVERSRGRTARAYDAGVPVRDLGDEDVHARPSCRRWFAADPRTERRDAERARPARPRRLGPADQRDADRHGRDEEGLGRRLPLGLQRRPAGGRPDAAEHALRDSRRSPEPRLSWRA